MSLISGCSDFLDVKDESAINSAIWDSEQSAMLYVYGSISPSACADEIGGDLNSLMEGSMDFGQVGAFSASTYAAVRYINIAFEELESSTMSEAEFNRVAGQLYFFRAWQHWKMILMHGGVPYMKKVVGYTSEDDLKNAKRDKTSECIK